MSAHTDRAASALKRFDHERKQLHGGRDAKAFASIGWIDEALAYLGDAVNELIAAVEQIERDREKERRAAAQMTERRR